MANQNQNQNQGSSKQGNKSNNDSGPKPSMKISHCLNWTPNSLDISIHVIVVADRAENCAKRKIRFYDPSSHKTLAERTSTKEGKASYTMSIPIENVSQGMKKKFGIALIAKIGQSGKTIDKQVFEEIEIDCKMPAGSLSKGCQTAYIRRAKHYKDFAQAVLIITGFAIFVKSVETSSFNIFLILSVVAILWLWWKRTKSKARTILCLIFLLFTFFGMTTSPEDISMPLIRGAVLSLVLGVPFYVLEEINRKPDGTSQFNYYPTIPALINFFFILYFLGKLLIGNWVGDSSSYDPLDNSAYLESGISWTILNYIPFMSLFDFRGVASDLNWIVSHFISFLIMVIYGGSRDLAEWYRSAKAGEKVDVSAGGFVGILAILKQIFDFFMEFIMPFIKGGSHRR